MHVLFTDLTDELGATAQARRIRLESFAGVDRIHADADLLRRILVNLVENAIRHAPPETVVSIRAIAAEGGTELSVTDSGSGVPSELRERVFDPFVQAEPGGDRRLTRSGRGLGLAFCKLAVEAHGGRTWIEDGAPGAIFKIRIPHD